MPRVYELPTHLQVEDQLIARLTARQLLRLVIGASLAYGVWDQLPWLPDEVRLGITMVLVAISVLFALVQPGGRGLDQWLMAGLLFMACSALPNACVLAAAANSLSVRLHMASYALATAKTHSS